MVNYRDNNDGINGWHDLKKIDDGRDQKGRRDLKPVNLKDIMKKVYLNKASKEELMKVETVGNHIADDVVRYREANGEVENLSDLRNKEGLDDKMQERMSKKSEL